MADIICLGEALIDFVAVEAEVSLEEANTFVKAAGGAPANVACAAARLGVRSAFVGKVGDDPFGRFLADTFAKAGADTSRMIFDKEHRTGLAFVALGPGMVPDFTFFRNPSADMTLTAEELDHDFLRSARAFHYGSITLISEPSRSATFAAIETAAQAGAMISYDPNLRPSLWESLEQARAGITEGLSFANILKLSTEELSFITGVDDLDAAAWGLLDANPRLRVIFATMGEKGCLFWAENGMGVVPGFKVEVVDTTGAGDGFAAAVLVELLRKGYSAANLSGVPRPALADICRFANAVGALSTTKKGAIAALPTRGEAEKLLK